MLLRTEEHPELCCSLSLEAVTTIPAEVTPDTPQGSAETSGSILNVTQQNPETEHACGKPAAFLFYLSVSAIQIDPFNVIIIGITPVEHVGTVVQS